MRHCIFLILLWKGFSNHVHPIVEVPSGVHIFISSISSGNEDSSFDGFGGMSNNLGFQNSIMWFVYNNNFTYILPPKINYRALHHLGSQSLFHPNQSSVKSTSLLEFPAAAWKDCIHRDVRHFEIEYTIAETNFSTYWRDTMHSTWLHDYHPKKMNLCLVLNIDSINLIGATSFDYSKSRIFLARHYHHSNPVSLIPEKYRGAIVLHHRLGDVDGKINLKRGQAIETIAAAKFVFERLKKEDMDKEVFLMSEATEDHPDVLEIQKALQAYTKVVLLYSDAYETLRIMANARVLIVGRSGFGLLGVLFNYGNMTFAPQGILNWVMNRNTNYYHFSSNLTSNETDVPTINIKLCDVNGINLKKASF
jgi:hypothetical protein